MVRLRVPLSVLAFVTILGALAVGQDTVRVSVSSRGSQGDQDSGGHASCSISPDGRFVVFMSYATNLVPGDTNGVSDIFVHDRLTGGTTRVSTGVGGAEANDASIDSYQNMISADGRRVAFQSLASNLVPGDTNGAMDIFVRDLPAGPTRRVSVDSAGAQGNGDSSDYSLSRDGRYVVFRSLATNLVPGDTNGADDLFLHDLVTGQTVRISVDSAGAQGDGDSYDPSISADDRFVAFQSEASNLVAGDTNGAEDVFVHDLSNGQTFRVSVSDSGQEGNADSDFPAISADGRFVVFASVASNLVPGDIYGVKDIFVRDLVPGHTQLVSVDSAGNPGWNSSDYQSAISATGRYVAFASLSENIAPQGGAPLAWDEFVHDLQTGQTSLVDVSSAGSIGPNGGYSASMSADGRFITFESRSTNFAPYDTNGAKDVFVRDVGSPQASYSCLGDGHGGSCPCQNTGAANRGCENAAATGGASITDYGTASVSTDTLILAVSGELRSAPTVLVQADAQVAPAAFGHGLLCAGGHVQRLFSKNASAGGVVAFPGPGDPSIAARSAAQGNPIAAGSTMYYQAICRDANQAQCPSTGPAWNDSSGLAVLWGL